MFFTDYILFDLTILCHNYLLFILYHFLPTMLVCILCLLMLLYLHPYFNLYWMLHCHCNWFLCSLLINNSININIKMMMMRYLYLCYHIIGSSIDYYLCIDCNLVRHFHIFMNSLLIHISILRMRLIMLFWFQYQGIARDFRDFEDMFGLLEHWCLMLLSVLQQVLHHHILSIR